MDIMLKDQTFGLTELGKFSNITHVEIKGPVGFAIDIAQGKSGNLWKQGKLLTKKALWQKTFWSNKTKVNQIIENIRPDAYLPESLNNVLGIYDL